MDDLIQSLDTVLGDGFVESIISALVTLLFLLVLPIVILLIIWLICLNIRNSAASVLRFRLFNAAENPSRQNAAMLDDYLKSLGTVKTLLLKTGKKARILRLECVCAFNTSIALSEELPPSTISEIRTGLARIGCRGMIGAGFGRQM